MVLTDESGSSEEQLESRDKNHVEGYRQVQHNMDDIEISSKEVRSSKWIKFCRLFHKISLKFTFPGEFNESSIFLVNLMHHKWMSQYNSIKLNLVHLT